VEPQLLLLLQVQVLGQLVAVLVVVVVVLPTSQCQQ
jgi:hypothetical protein